MSAALQFPGGVTELPEPTRADLLANAAEWLALVEEHVATIKHDIARGDIHDYPILALRSAVERLAVALTEAK